MQQQRQGILDSLKTVRPFEFQTTLFWRLELSQGLLFAVKYRRENIFPVIKNAIKSELNLSEVQNSTTP